MGLAREIAYSSLLAFFPAVIALVGLLDLINAYGTLRSFLAPVTSAETSTRTIEISFSFQNGRVSIRS